MRLLRRHEVEALTGLSRSSIYKRMLAGTFPRPVPIGPHAVRWRSTDVDAWLAAVSEGRAWSPEPVPEALPW